MMIPGQKVIYDIVREKVVVKEVNVDVETCEKTETSWGSFI